ncbi:MAG: DUF2608 domain-containing protein [Rickettsiaceae bacterium]|nr:DUF2608 domain-containing protein [Rickettsiaceae bacterium]
MKLLTKLIMVLLMLSDIQLAIANGSFITLASANEVLLFLKKLPKDSIIFVDVDDTIITPVSKTFRKEPYNKLIDEIKKERSKYENYEEIISNWRLQRKVMLVDQDWPDTLLRLKIKYKVYGLTKMDHGKFGNISSMEKWRYEELKSLNIEFSNNELIPPSVDDSAFFKGIFFAGSNTKSETLLYYLKYLNASTYVMIDDRPEHLEDIRKFCENNSIKFIGILYKGMDRFTDSPDPDVALFQKKYLIQNAQWIEDDEAKELAAKSSH